MVFAATADDSPQLNCCDGLVCCDTEKYGLVCLECCNDHDCAHGCSCHDGFCSCPCGSDKDCAKDTCCCKNGSCSADCCPKKPDEENPGTPVKPGTSAKPGASTGGEAVHTLPSTGSGPDSPSAGWIGAAALGAAAAYLAGKAMKGDDPEPEAAEE
jgi:hypothetical protein